MRQLSLPFILAVTAPSVTTSVTYGFVAPPARYLDGPRDHRAGGCRCGHRRKPLHRRNGAVSLCSSATPHEKSTGPTAKSGINGDGGGIVPRHCAFICDGNARWARLRHLPDSIGHARGADALIAALGRLRERGVKVATFYGFSTENWSRPVAEIRDIWSVIEKTAMAFRERAIRERVRVKFLGDLDDQRIPSSARDCLRALERDTSCFGSEPSNGPLLEPKSKTTLSTETLTEDSNGDADNNPDGDSSMTLCIAVNYGGRKDILNASLQIANALSLGKIKAADVDEAAFHSYLYTSDVPEPDLCVRTGGERRLSNFLLWDLAYSELYFTDTLWPDFDESCVDSALDWYMGRTRRYGGRETGRVKAQVEKE